MLNVKVGASCVNSVNNTQIKPTAISDKKDTLNVVSKMLNNFVIMLFFNWGLLHPLCYLFVRLILQILLIYNSLSYRLNKLMVFDF